MESNQAFGNPDIAPTDAAIADVLCQSYFPWELLVDRLCSPEFGLVLEWHFYRDGGWLCKALKGKKNLAWLSVREEYATITFYFPTRLRDDLLALPIPKPLHDQIAGAQPVGASVPVGIELHTQEDVDAACDIMAYKRSVK